jgi:hypothetical protein
MALSLFLNLKRLTRIPSLRVTLLNIQPGKTLKDVTDIPFNLMKGI